MHERDVVTLARQRCRCLHAEYAAAQHYRRPGDILDGAGFCQGAKGEHMRRIAAGDRRHNRGRTGGKHQRIPAQRASRGMHFTRVDVYCERRFSSQHRHASCRVPVFIVQTDVLRLLFATQHWRKLDAVVCLLRLVTDDGDSETTGNTPGERRNQPGCRHTITDNDQSHRAPSLRRFRLFFVEEMEDLLAYVVIAAVVRQLHPVARARQIDAQDLTHGGRRAVGHHQYAVRE